MKEHRYLTQLQWTGNDGSGTSDYRNYRRDHTVRAAGRPDLLVSSDPTFRGDPTRYNPETMLVASLSSCHLLWYLHLCSAASVVVTACEDEATGSMHESDDGAGRFASVELRPRVTISAASDPAQARALHEEAHRYCFIANSVNFPVTVEPVILLADAG